VLAYPETELAETNNRTKYKPLKTATKRQVEKAQTVV
jgi:hypothetical protein